MFAPPEILSGNYSEKDLSEFRLKRKVWKTVDIYESQIRELAEINFPSGSESDRNAYILNKGKGGLNGVWVYYPWSGILLHCVNNEDLFTLRTNRNKNLVNLHEQQKLANSVIGIAGMSVGSGIALSCAYSGYSNTIKIADFDILETANLNRLREGLSNVGQPKVELTAQNIYELNPFADINTFSGLTNDNLDSFLQDPRCVLVIDEIDDFKMKVHIRLKAKELGIPILMLTSLGDNILIDVERYDLDSSLSLFNGAIGSVANEILKNEITPEIAKRYAVQIVGQEFVPTKALDSLLQIGKTLVGRPQLYSTIAVDGGLAAFVIKKIVLGEPIKSGRYFVNFSELVGLEDDDLSDSSWRQEVLRKFTGR